MGGSHLISLQNLKESGGLPGRAHGSLLRGILLSLAFADIAVTLRR